jgi:hypothetical protein
MGGQMKKNKSIKLSLIPIFLAFFLIGCMNDIEREEYIVLNQESEWKLEGKVYRDGNNSWYLDVDVFYLGNKKISEYSMEITVPQPLSTNSSLTGGNAKILEESSIGARLHSTRIHGSESFDGSKILSALTEGFIEINWSDNRDRVYIDTIVLNGNNKN